MSHHHEEDTFSSRVDWRLWRQVFQHAWRHRRLVIPLAFTSVLIAAVDSSFALVTRSAVDAVAVHGAQASLVGQALAYGGLTAGLAVGVWFFIMLAGSVASHVSHDIRRDGFARLQELEFAFFDTRPTGWLVSRLTSDCDKLARIISWGFLDCLWAVCLVLMITFQLLRLDWQLGLIVLAVVPLLLAISAGFQKRMLLSARETRRYNSMITAAFTEALGGMRTTRTLVRERDNLDEFTGLSGRMFDASLRNARQSALYVPIVLTLGSVAGGLALWAGGSRLLEGHLSIGTLVAFLFYTGQFFHPVNAIASTLVQMQGAQAAGERVLGLLATQPRIQDSPAVREKLARHSAAASIARDRAPDGHEHHIRSIEFRDVGFRYDTGRSVLEGFNLTVRAGQTIALVGPSGGGKTTIVSLASRFYEPTSGQVLINGVDTRERSLAWLQSNLGIVLQQPHLFRGSVRENIRYGRLTATDAGVEAAARLVHAHEFITTLEQGYETAVGEGGNRLSTGQKQLVSFARALLADPQIFIMDEATSSIDTGTEQHIQAALRAVLRGRISFVIAHRLSTIRSADLIVVINNGRIYESGTHDELIRRRGHYHALYTGQFRHELQEKVLHGAQAGAGAGGGGQAGI